MIDKAAALYRLADLMDEDNSRTASISPCGHPVGIPVSYGHYLVWLAVIGTYEAWETEWVRLAREESLEAAMKWGAGLEQLIRELIGLVYPGGATASPLPPERVREIADTLTPDEDPS